MTTHTTSQPGWVIPAEQMGWDQDDWLNSYCSDAYSSSVIWAAALPGCCLAQPDLDALLRAHGTTVAELQADLSAGISAGCAVLPLAHAAQALAWLGY
jgi:MFS superfamily sulfate permease-like transporter